MSSLIYNNHQLTYKDGKFNLNEIYKILNYELLEENSFVDKEELLNLLNEEYDEDKNFINFLNNDFIEPIMDIFTFMNKNKLILFDNDVFNELWHSLKDKKEILITNNLLEFMGFRMKSNMGETSAHVINIKNYIDFLNENNIEFEQIDYKNIKAINYQEIQDYIKSADKKSLESKKWLIITLDNFKESIMVLNNKKANELRRYYIQLEKVFYLYSDYVKEYNLKLNELKYKQDLEIKNKTLEEKDKVLQEKDKVLQEKDKVLQEITSELKEKERIKSNINVVVNNIKMKKKNIYIYIATSKYYASLNIFKVGLTTNLINCLSSINSNNKNKNNNNNNTEDNRIYFCFFEKVYNVYELKSIINNLLEEFKDEKEKGMFNIHYTYLEKVIKLLIKNINNSYEYRNDLIKNKLTNMYNLKPYTPTEIFDNCIEENNSELS